MAAPTLRRFGVTPGVTTAATLVAAVGAGRALVIGKLIAANTSSGAATVTITVGGTVIYSASLPAGAQFAEQGLVVAAGETVTVQTSVANAVAFSAYGEEVDN